MELWRGGVLHIAPYESAQPASSNRMERFRFQSLYRTGFFSPPTEQTQVSSLQIETKATACTSVPPPDGVRYSAGQLLWYSLPPLLASAPRVRALLAVASASVSDLRTRPRLTRGESP